MTPLAVAGLLVLVLLLVGIHTAVLGWSLTLLAGEVER